MPIIKRSGVYGILNFLLSYRHIPPIENPINKKNTVFDSPESPDIIIFFKKYNNRIILKTKIKL